MEFESKIPFETRAVKGSPPFRQQRHTSSQSMQPGYLPDIKFFRHGLCIENQVLSESIVLPG